MSSVFAGRLRELREGAGLTQEMLASRSGLTTSAVSKLEQGSRVPSWDTVQALASALGVTCEAFTVEPSPAPPAKPGRPPKKEPEPPTAEEKPAAKPKRGKK